MRRKMRQLPPMNFRRVTMDSALPQRLYNAFVKDCVTFFN